MDDSNLKLDGTSEGQHKNNAVLCDVLSKKVFRAYCCGKKRHKNQLDFISNGYDGTGVFCKPNRGCKKHIT